MMSFLPFFPSHLESMGVEGLGAIATWAGLIYGAAPLAAAFMSPIWGALGDRFGRRLMVLRSMFAIALFVAGMAFATSPFQLLLLRIGQGLFSGFVAPSLTLVSVAAPLHLQGRIQASLQTAMTIGGIAGPAMGEALRRIVGMREAYLCVSGLALLAAVLIVVFAREEAAHRREPSGERSLLGVLKASFGDLGELRTNRGVRVAVVLLFWIQFGLGATNPLLEIFVGELPPRPEATIPSSVGLLFSVMAVANLVTLRTWGRLGDAHGPERMLKRCAFLCAAALALHAVVPSYLPLLAMRFLLGAAMAGSGPLAFGVAAAETSIERRGGAFGVVFSARAFAVALAAMVGGALSSVLTLRGLFCASAVLLALSAGIVGRAPRKTAAVSPDPRDAT